MIDRKELAKSLGKQDVADWVITERDQELAVIADDTRRQEVRARWQVTVHADTPGGRGSASVMLDANEGDPDRVVDQAVALAKLSVGPAWATVPQAAPARVDLADPAWVSSDALAAVDKILATLPRNVIARASLLREHVMVQTKQGFHAEWQATLAHVDVLVAQNGHSLQIARDARRADRLDIIAAISDANADLAQIAVAKPPTTGDCAVILGGDALLHNELGVWRAFVTQADAVVSRQGLTRYHEHTPIAPGADQVPEPLTIWSDGAMPFGLLSAPLGDDGDAVRRFPLVLRGIAAGLGLSQREAALRHREPNGGVRNLVVELGTWNEQALPTRTIAVSRLRALEIDPYTGDAELEILLGTENNAPFVGGTLRLDLIDVLARARRSARRVQRGAYDGPAAVLIANATLI